MLNKSAKVLRKETKFSPPSSLLPLSVKKDAEVQKFPQALSY